MLCVLYESEAAVLSFGVPSTKPASSCSASASRNVGDVLAVVGVGRLILDPEERE